MTIILINKVHFCPGNPFIVCTLGHEKITVSALVLPFKLGPELEGVGAGETGNSIVTVIVDRQAISKGGTQLIRLICLI